MLAALTEAETVHQRDLFGGPARVLSGTAAGLSVFVIDAPHLYDRPGTPYNSPDGWEWPDNPLRFAGLARIGADIGQGAVPGFVPGIVHAHDWQAGLAPAWLHYESGANRPGTVMTIHNLAFQGPDTGDGCWARWACRTGPTASTAWSITAPSAC